MFACYSRTIHTLPSDSLCLRTAFAFKVPLPLPSKDLCFRRAFAFKVPFGHCKRRAFALEGNLLSWPLPSWDLCLQTALAFHIEAPLPSESICHRGLRQRGTFAFKLPLSLPSPCLCNRGALAFKEHLSLSSTCLCHRGAFAFKLPLPLWHLCLHTAFAFAFKVPLPLPSKGLCHRSALALAIERLSYRCAFAFKVPLPLPSKGLCLQSAIAFAIERPLPSKCPWFCRRTDFAVYVPLPHRRAFCFKPTLYM
jgi:hypothetical protein